MDTSKCVMWRGAKNNPNTKRVIRRKDPWIGRRISKTPARYYWELENNQPVPLGMVVGHMCGNRLCINTKHLIVATKEALTMLYQAQGRVIGQRPHKMCNRGHPLAGENSDVITYFNKTDHRWIRKCRICRRIRDRNRVAREKNGS